MTLLDVARSGPEVGNVSDNSCELSCCVLQRRLRIGTVHNCPRLQLAAMICSSKRLHRCFSKHPITKVFTIDQISAQLGQPLMTISPPTTAMLVCLDAFYRLPCDPCKLAYRCSRSNGREIWGAYHLHQWLVRLGSPLLYAIRSCKSNRWGFPWFSWISVASTSWSQSWLSTSSASPPKQDKAFPRPAERTGRSYLSVWGIHTEFDTYSKTIYIYIYIVYFDLFCLVWKWHIHSTVAGTFWLSLDDYEDLADLQCELKRHRFWQRLRRRCSLQCLQNWLNIAMMEQLGGHFSMVFPSLPSIVLALVPIFWLYNPDCTVCCPRKVEENWPTRMRVETTWKPHMQCCRWRVPSRHGFLLSILSKDPAAFAPHASTCKITQDDLNCMTLFVACLCREESSTRWEIR